MGSRPARSAAPAREELDLPQEAIELLFGDLWKVALAARRLVMARRRVLHAEEVVENRPRVRGAVARLTLPDEQDHDSPPSAWALRRLHRERQPPAVVEMQPADDRLQRPGEPVCADVGGAWITLELRVDLTVTGALTGELVYKWANRTRDDDFEARHAKSLRARSD
jgi:hypothetical protein